MLIKKTLVWFCVLCVALSVGLDAQRPDAQARQELQQPENDVPQLIEVLGLAPSMTVADVGAGFGAMVQVLATRLGPTSRIYATDVAAPQLDTLRDMQDREGLRNVTVVVGGDRRTNLPDSCCDAIYMRDVYHHFTQPKDMNESLYASLKAGGRLAVIDFESEPGSKLPTGVDPNRGGHGINPTIVIDEMTAAGFVHERTVARWPEPKGGYFLVLFRKP